MSQFNRGDPVWANLGNGGRVAHVMGKPYDVQGESGPEQKYDIQGPGDGEPHPMAYTAEVNDDGDPPGGFFTDL